MQVMQDMHVPGRGEIKRNARWHSCARMVAGAELQFETVQRMLFSLALVSVSARFLVLVHAACVASRMHRTTLNLVVREP